MAGSGEGSVLARPRAGKNASRRAGDGDQERPQQDHGAVLLAEGTAGALADDRTLLSALRPAAGDAAHQRGSEQQDAEPEDQEPDHAEDDSLHLASLHRCSAAPRSTQALYR